MIAGIAGLGLIGGSFAKAYNIGTGNSWQIRIAPFRGFN